MLYQGKTSRPTSPTLGHGTQYTIQYTDSEGHVEFLRHPAKPLHVKIVVRGESFGPYTIENEVKYTVEISGE